ncbi:hypothetical protein SAMN05216191_103164 [Paenibacillus jilunlii]|uniref:Uncharacterized protein n=1 Tax=Paenibacillus jilunlii TaxID=682956 RepID=A0A1G9K9H4_9BACL|nr:hypothetical protein SAMN05216191_103164 [Paenibacillus jilunlii]
MADFAPFPIVKNKQGNAAFTALPFHVYSFYIT